MGSPVQAGDIGLNQESADPFVLERPVHAGEDNGKVCAEAVGDPDFLAVEDVVIAIFPGGSLHAGGIRTRLRLGQRIAANPLAAGEQGQIMAFL